MSTGSSIAAVIPVHNRADLLSRLLDTIRNQTLPFSELIAVDNSSTDSAPEVARNSGCKIIQMGENAGFARAVNRGWETVTSGSGSEWIAILNTDVELDPRWAERLVAAAGDASFAAGTILSASDRNAVDGTYDLVSRGACAWRAGHGTPRADLSKTCGPMAIAPGTACLFRRTALESLHGFDERFESYLEDIDLGLRCVREGLRGVFVPGAIAWHHGSATLGRWNPTVVRLISRNQLFLVAHHYDRDLFWSCLWPIIAGQLLWGIVAMRHGAFGAWLSGKREALRSFRIDAVPSAALREFLTLSEREIAGRARDPYWRWYFRLTAGGAH